jgi:hypothetical protein
MLLIHCTIDLAFGIFFIFFSELCLTALRSQSFSGYTLLRRALIQVVDDLLVSKR